MFNYRKKPLEEVEELKKPILNFYLSIDKDQVSGIYGYKKGLSKTINQEINDLNNLSAREDFCVNLRNWLLKEATILEEGQSKSLKRTSDF